MITRTSLRCSVSLVVLLLAGSCRTAHVPVAAATAPGADSLVLERSLCFGSCPSYRVRLSTTGHVHFESRNPQDSGRTAEDQADIPAVGRLFATAHSIGLDTLPSKLLGHQVYCRLVATDFPYATLTLYHGA